MDFLNHSFYTKKVFYTKINAVNSKNNVGKNFIDVYREMKEAPINKIHQSKVSVALNKK